MKHDPSKGRTPGEELCLDYEDYLRQRSLPLWPEGDSRRKALIARRCTPAEAVADGVKEMHGRNGPDGQPRHEAPSIGSKKSIPSTSPEIAANAALVLLGVAGAPLDRQIAARATAFTEEGGFTERLYRIRTAQSK